MEREYELHLEFGDGQNNEFLAEVLSFEKMLRLNPYWVIKDIETKDNGFVVQAEDHETNAPFSFSGDLIHDDEGVILRVDALNWQQITLFERNGELLVRVVFDGEQPEVEEQKVIYWLRSIREYIRIYVTTNLWTKAHRYLMNKILLPMSPSQRKISLMLIRLSILEIFVILLIVVGYFYFN